MFLLIQWNTLPTELLSSSFHVFDRYSTAWGRPYTNLDRNQPTISCILYMISEILLICSTYKFPWFICLVGSHYFEQWDSLPDSNVQLEMKHLLKLEPAAYFAQHTILMPVQLPQTKCEKAAFLPLSSTSIDLNTSHNFFSWSDIYCKNSSNDKKPSLLWSPSDIIFFKLKKE